MSFANELQKRFTSSYMITRFHSYLYFLPTLWQNHHCFRVYILFSLLFSKLGFFTPTSLLNILFLTFPLASVLPFLHRTLCSAVQFVSVICIQNAGNKGTRLCSYSTKQEWKPKYWTILIVTRYPLSNSYHAERFHWHTYRQWMCFFTKPKMNSNRTSRSMSSADSRNMKLRCSKLKHYTCHQRLRRNTIRRLSLSSAICYVLLRYNNAIITITNNIRKKNFLPSTSKK